MSDVIKTDDYREWLRDLKQKIQRSQIKAALSVNSQLILLYWDLGKQIVDIQEKRHWGNSFFEQLSKDLTEEFPEMKGFSLRNLQVIKQWYLFYSKTDLSKTKQLVSYLYSIDNNEVTDSELPTIDQSNQFVKQLVSQFENNENELVEQPVQQLVAQLEPHLYHPENKEDIIRKQLVSKLISIPWGHHIKIMQKIKDPTAALFYINKTIENNWSRSILEYHLETDLYNRQGKAITNFNQTLPEPQSDLATEIIKSSYNFEFLRLSEKARETDIEKALVSHLQQFLLEMGVGFAYMGRQYVLKVGDDDYRTDLLFYHTKLKCYVIIELKTKKFEPEFIGKLNFYVTAVNELIRDENDKPTIGILLCKNKNNFAVKFSLKNVNNPIGVSTYHFTELTDEMKSALPSEETLQNELINFERLHAKR